MTAVAMEVAGQVLLVVSIALPLLTAAWVGLTTRAPARAALAATVVAWLACGVLAALVLAGVEMELALFELVPPVHLVLRVDAAGALFALTVASLNVLAVIHAGSWLADDRANDRHARAYFAVTLACLGLMLLVAFAANLVTLLVAYELFSLASFVLIVHRRTPEAFRAGIKYLVYVIPGASLTLVGTLLVFFVAGALDFTPGGLAGLEAAPALATTAWACLVFGFGVKAALFPLHGWVPDAHPAAPAPFSAVLSGVMVATGVFAIIRVLYEIFGPAVLHALGVMPWLVVPAALGVVLAGVFAIGEDELKRRLAWSTISQMGYATLAAALLHPAALAAALVHLAAHAFIKGGLFFAVGAIARHARVHRVSELNGLARRMPITAVLLSVLALALIGLPPLAGFVAKWLLVTGAAAAQARGALAVLATGSLLAALYLWPVLAAIWTRPDAHTDAAVGDPADGMRLATALAAGLALLFGIGAAWTGYPLALARRAAETLTGAG
ncbi:MAG: proton-conducting transporter membrane subunit [Wenzhouxiangellaceae bacterium]|nr:proton-conducting transporter membrane subunit [Wenzhouxiangellaceae bacterium]